MNSEIVLKTGSRLLARFQPRRTDDLKPGAVATVWRSGLFEALWPIEDGEYAGEWAMKIPKDWGVLDAIWVPSGDLRFSDMNKPGVDTSMTAEPEIGRSDTVIVSSMNGGSSNGYGPEIFYATHEWLLLNDLA